MVRRPDDQPALTDNVIVDQIADGLNFHTGVTNSVVSNNFVRNTGDDALAMWSENTANANNTFDHNTVQSPVLANGIAVYGGTDNTVSEQPRRRPGPGGQRPAGRLPVRRHRVRRPPVDHQQHHGPGRHLRAQLEHRSGRDLDLRARAVHRRGRPGRRGQLPRQRLQRDHAGQRLPGEGPVLDLECPLQGHQGRRHGYVGGERPRRPARRRSRTWTPATSAPSASTTAVRSTSPPAGSEFSLTDLGGNDGGGITGPWLAPWELPNTITCDDRPPVAYRRPPPPGRNDPLRSAPAPPTSPGRRRTIDRNVHMRRSTGARSRFLITVVGNAGTRRAGCPRRSPRKITVERNAATHRGRAPRRSWSGLSWVRRQSALARGRSLAPYRWILDHRGAKRRGTPRTCSKEISTEDHDGAKRRATPRTCSKEILVGVHGYGVRVRWREAAR